MRNWIDNIVYFLAGGLGGSYITFAAFGDSSKTHLLLFAVMLILGNWAFKLPDDHDYA